jgi:outer membrane protein OmpA-like peptidoglycan-associated protein
MGFMAGLIDTILGAIPPSTTASLANQFGATSNATQGALGGIVPVILGAIAAKAQSGGASGVTDLIRGALTGGNPLDAVADGGAPTVPIGQASNILGSLFGTQLPTIATALAGAFGLRGDAITGLLSFAAPLVIGGIGKALGGDVTPAGVTSLMERERPSILAALPAGLGSLLGIGGVGAAAAASRVPDLPVPPPSSGLAKWLPWLIGLLVLLGLLFALSHCRQQTPVPGAAPLTTDTSEAPAAIPTGAGVTTETRSGKPVVIVYFDTAKADVAPAFADAAGGLKTYLNQNPAGKLTVSGFNDPTGNAAINEALSKKRAQAVKAALLTAGVSADQIALVKPADTTDTSTSMDNARRVEIVAQ